MIPAKDFAWHIEECERRIIALAIATGHPELATPFAPSPFQRQAVDHTHCVPLDKFDRCRLCQEPIVNNQSFHLQHAICGKPPVEDFEPWT